MALLGDKSAQINKVFVFLVSFIIIGFVSYMFLTFISGFGKDVKDRIDIDFYNSFQSEVNRVSKSWGMESEKEFRVSKSVEFVCLLEKNIDSCSNVNGDFDIDSLKEISKTNKNLVLADSKGPIRSFEVDFRFNVDDPNRCSCYSVKNNRISLFFVNNRNKVFVSNLF